MKRIQQYHIPDGLSTRALPINALILSVSEGVVEIVSVAILEDATDIVTSDCTFLVVAYDTALPDDFSLQTYVFVGTVVAYDWDDFAVTRHVFVKLAPPDASETT